jgi:SAM-dependent methyltransferase
VTTLVERYDASADAYLAWWAPVLEPTAQRVLDMAAPGIDRVVRSGRGGQLVDIGTGTGALAIAAARRWPEVEVIAVDASSGMLDVARRQAGRSAPEVARRIRFVNELADRLPLSDASVDVVASSFVLQLVPDRGRVLREAHRILRPHGTLAYVTWRAGADDPFAPNEAFYDALDDAGVPDEGPSEEPRSGDVPSAAAAAQQARRAGFRRVVARETWLEHAFDRSTYLEFLERYDERETFEDLTEAQRIAVRTAARRRLGQLDAAAFIWRAPIVTLVAERAG